MSASKSQSASQTANRRSGDTREDPLLKLKEPQRLRTFYQSAEADAVAGMRDPDPSTEPNLEEQKKGVYRQDREAIMGVIRQLEPLSREAGQTPAASLIAATMPWI